MNTAEIVMREVQGNSGFQVRQPFAVRIRQPREAANLHPHREVLPFHERRADVLMAFPLTRDSALNRARGTVFRGVEIIGKLLSFSKNASASSRLLVELLGNGRAYCARGRIWLTKLLPLPTSIIQDGSPNTKLRSWSWTAKSAYSGLSQQKPLSLYITAQLVEQAKSAGIRGAAQRSDIGEVVRGIEALLRDETFFNENRQTQIN